jgi:hypothetical protein
VARIRRGPTGSFIWTPETVRMQPKTAALSSQETAAGLSACAWDKHATRREHPVLQTVVPRHGGRIREVDELDGSIPHMSWRAVREAVDKLRLERLAYTHIIGGGIAVQLQTAGAPE